MKTGRTDKEILDSTRPFAIDDRARSWMHVTTTFALVAIAAACAMRAPWSALRAAACIVEGLLLVRAFILFHDHLHGAILRGSPLARAVFWVYGMIVLTPPRVWRETHNYHHAHNAKIVGSHVGSYPVVTLAMWSRMSTLERFAYRAARHPLTILLGYFTVFLWGMCVAPLARAPKKNWSAAAAIATQGLLAWATIHWIGVSAYVVGVFLPLAIAMASGAYLFYGQHNFPDVVYQPRESWSYVRAALESSSYMAMGPAMRFFAGNIGYHHVHHLNSSIPFYRLPDAMAAIPELREPRTTTLAFRDVAACFRLKVWDPARGEMVPVPESAERASAPAA